MNLIFLSAMVALGTMPSPNQVSTQHEAGAFQLVAEDQYLTDFLGSWLGDGTSNAGESDQGDRQGPDLRGALDHGQDSWPGDGDHAGTGYGWGDGESLAGGENSDGRGNNNGNGNVGNNNGNDNQGSNRGNDHVGDFRGNEGRGLASEGGTGGGSGNGNGNGNGNVGSGNGNGNGNGL